MECRFSRVAIALAVLLAAGSSRAAEPVAKASVATRPAGSASFQPFDPESVRADDTLASMKKRFGPDEVKADEVPGAEEMLPGWILHPRDPQRRIYIYLDDSGKHPANLMVHDPQSRWQRGDGIHMGVTLTELVARNGRPIEFSGFDWDYGGVVTNWHGGKLKDTRSITLCPPEHIGDKEKGPYPSGDATFSSKLPIVVRYPPKVCSFSLGEPAGSQPAPGR